MIETGDSNKFMPAFHVIIIKEKASQLKVVENKGWGVVIVTIVLEKRSLMRLQKVSTQVSLRSPRRLTLVETFSYRFCYSQKNSAPHIIVAPHNIVEC